MNTNCPSKQVSNVALFFLSSVEGVKQYFFPFEHNLTCVNLTYGMIDNYLKKKLFQCLLAGVNYDINGYLQCGERYVSLSPRTRLYGKYSILM